jgi:parvulin-like peptidyl-prolyl isomerase
MIGVCFLAGCQKSDSFDGKVVARINDYDLTVADFRNEAVILRANKDLSSDPKKAKSQLLQDIIGKKLFIQEAQKLNFDKQKYFMSEIERYWEQALLKILFKKKAEELYRSIDVTSAEIEEQYNKMKKKFYAQILILDDKFAAEMLVQPGTNFDQLKNGFRNNIISSRGPAWFTCAELPKPLEDVLYLLEPGQVSVPIKYAGNWAVIRLIRQEEIALDRMDKMSERIRHDLLESKKSEVMQIWMDEIKKNAKIKIDSKILDEMSF